MTHNYGFKWIADMSLRTNRAILPACVIAASAIMSSLVARMILDGATIGLQDNARFHHSPSTDVSAMFIISCVTNWTKLSGLEA